MLNCVLNMVEDTEEQPKTWKKRNVSEMWPLFIGDFVYINEVLAKKPSNSPWLLLQYFNALLRSFGQVMLANNPISGAIVMLAVGVANYLALCAAIFTCTISFIFSLIFRQDSSAILNGCYGFNPVIHATVSVNMLPIIYPEIDIYASKFWLFLFLVTIMSIYLTSALNSFFKHVGRYPIPSFSLSFNILEFMLIFCLLHNSVPTHIVSPHLLIAPGLPMISNNSKVIERHFNSLRLDKENNATGTTGLNWGDTFSGTILALSQVYGLNNVPCAALLYLALLIYSPIMTAFAYMGSIIGTLMGTFLTDNYDEIYNGIWGYNGLLCAAALGGFCFVLNVQSTLAALVSAIFTTILQHLFNPLFANINFPILSMPFNITTILFLFVTTEKEESLARPETLTFPESHRHAYKSMTERPQQGYLHTSKIYDDKDVI